MQDDDISQALFEKLRTSLTQAAAPARSLHALMADEFGAGSAYAKRADDIVRNLQAQIDISAAFLDDALNNGDTP